MSAINHGGPAFPLYQPSDGMHAPFAVDGMSLRAYIATHAMAGYIASFGGLDVPAPSPAGAADYAVKYADALIKALNGGQS